ncbi:MAG TPA: hypothetical protein VNO55_27025, partial [Polyangia bacterium]|nr:hypothetical protein [Polyangia bacterium]
MLRVAVGVVAVLNLLAAAGCSGDCCAVDSFPIIGARAPLGPLSATAPGGLLAAASDDADGAAGFKMLIDTG